MDNASMKCLGEFFALLLSSAAPVPQGRCDCTCCWSIELMHDGFWYCRTCGRYVGTDITG
ncbi:MAG: hypothetical protein ACKVP0_14535 [Pirellulaceae bacterium]